MRFKMMVTNPRSRTNKRIMDVTDRVAALMADLDGPELYMARVQIGQALGAELHWECLSPSHGVCTLDDAGRYPKRHQLCGWAMDYMVATPRNP